MIENFILGIGAIGSNIIFNLTIFFTHPIIIGFLIGIIASTGIHMIVSTEKIHYIPCILTKKTAESYTCLSPKNKNGVLITYSDFIKRYNRVRITFYILFTLFLLIVAIAFFKF